MCFIILKRTLFSRLSQLVIVTNTDYNNKLNQTS